MAEINSYTQLTDFRTHLKENVNKDLRKKKRMTAAGPVTGESEGNVTGESEGYVKKKVHFEDIDTKKKKKIKKSAKRPKKKSAKSKDVGNIEVSNVQAKNESKTSSKDDAGKPRLKKMEDSSGQKVGHPQTPVRSRAGSVVLKSGNRVARASSTCKVSKDNKQMKGDLKKNWQSINFREQFKMDMFDITKRAIGSNIAGRKPLDVDSTYVPTPALNRRAWSSLSLSSNYEALDVLSAIEQQQKKRHQEHINSQLELIQKRVRKTLEDFGIESDSEEEEDALKLPPIYDTNTERKKMAERDYVIDRIDAFEEKALVRKQHLTEVMFWFEDHLNMSSDIITAEEMKEMVQLTQELHQVISKSLQAFIRNGEEVVEKGKLLLAETSKIVEERKAQMSKKTRKERITVYDDKILLSDPVKWESAAKTILSVFEDSYKMIKNLMFKNAIRLCQKQFDYMMVACDKRFKELDEKKKQCIDLQGKLHSAKIQSDKLNREIEEQKKKFTKQSQELFDTKQTVEKLQERNREMSNKVEELNSKIKLLEGELRVKNRTPTPPPTPPPPAEPEKIYVKVVDSSTELKLREVEEELQNAKREIEKFLSDLNEVNEQFKVEQDKNKELLERITDLEKVEPEEPAPPNVSPVVEAPVPETRRPSDVPDKDVNYYKTLMSGMKKEFEVEMEKVKSHVRKEKTRGDASLKKLEYQHKDHLANIQKDTVRMLRGIMHFRDHMLACLEKENLIDQAQALHELGDMVKDKISPDPKEVLGTIVSTVVDYLHKVEGILSNSFLAMRILMKYQIDKQVEIEVQQRMALKEVQMKAREMKAPKKQVNSLVKSLKKAKNKLKKAKQNITNFASDKKYLDLLSRYNAMMKLYKGMQKEMEVLQSDFHDTMQKKLEEKETMVISQIKMEMKQKKALAEEQLKMSIADQRQNLKMLSMAYEQNKISKELHLMATAMIQKTMDIPRRKLKTLFEKYITYRTIKDSKDRVVRVLKDEHADLSIDTRGEMEQYIRTIDGKFKDSIQKWKDEMRQLDNEKHDLNRRIYNLFNEVLVESGVLFVHPLLRDKNKVSRITRAASQMHRSQVRDILFRKKKRCKEFLTLPDELLGRRVTLGHGDTKLWIQKGMEQSRGVAASVISPHMLAYEINKPRIEASRTLFGTRHRYSLGKTESFNISRQNYVQFIRDIPPHEMELKHVFSVSSGH